MDANGTALTGEIVKYNEDGGWGFIAPRGGSLPGAGDTWFHYSAVKNKEIARVGQIVKYEIENDPKRHGRERAKYVEIIR